MYLRVKGSGFTENVFAEIAALTDRSKLKLRHVNYKKEDGIVSFRMERYAVKARSKLFEGLLPHKLDKSQKISCVVTIKNITYCSIENNIDDQSVSEVILLFGMKVQDHEIYLCSAEEVQGVTLYSIDLRVSEIDIEMRDDSEAAE